MALENDIIPNVTAIATHNWFAYSGEGDIYDPASYRKATNLPLCERGNFICAIYALSDGITPIISSRVLQYISNALISGHPQPPKTNSKTRNLVYLKG